MRQMGSMIQSLRDKHRSGKGQIEKLRSRDNALQQYRKDMSKALQDAQEELQGNEQQFMDIEKEMQDFKDEIKRLEKTQTKDEDQVTRVVCSKARRTHRVVGEQQQAFLQSVKVCGIDERGSRQTPSERKCAICKNSAEVEKEEDKPEASGQHTGPVAAEGANQVPSPVTPTDWQSKRLDEHWDDDLDLDGDRLPVQSPFPNASGRSRSPVPGVRSGAEGGAWSTEKAFLEEKRAEPDAFVGILNTDWQEQLQFKNGMRMQKQVVNIAAADARGRAEIEDGKRTSREVTLL